MSDAIVNALSDDEDNEISDVIDEIQGPINFYGAEFSRLSVLYS